MGWDTEGLRSGASLGCAFVGRRALTPPRWCGGLRAARRPTILAPLPKGGWHGEAVTGGFLPAPASRKRTPHTPQVSLHQPSVGPPPFRQGRLWRQGADYRDRFVNWPAQCHGILHGAIVAPPPAFVNMFKNCLQGGHLHLKFDALQYGQ